MNDNENETGGDLRAVLFDAWQNPPELPADYPANILAALHAADEPLVSEVECPRCRHGRWHSGHSVRGVWLTEDVLRARLREALGGVTLNRPMVDAIVRALFGEAS